MAADPGADLWLTIEVSDSPVQTARQWMQAWATPIIWAGFQAGAIDWDSQQHEAAFVLMACFATADDRDAFTQIPVILAALDAVPDPATGVIVHPGRADGGEAGVMARLPGGPPPMAGSVALPLPDEPSGRIAS